jgi:hypothetical protein
MKGVSLAVGSTLGSGIWCGRDFFSSSFSLSFFHCLIADVHMIHFLFLFTGDEFDAAATQCVDGLRTWVGSVFVYEEGYEMDEN